MEWRPCEVLKNISENSGSPTKQNVAYAIVLLNQSIQNEPIFLSLWNNASFRAIADGGGNHWYYLAKKYPGVLKIPNIVSGDFDSIRPEVLEFFKDDGTIEIILTEDQDETDFTKAVRVSADRISKSHPEITKIVAFCETSGRFDQIMANVETLYHAQHILIPGQQMFLMSSSSMTWLLPVGLNQILFSNGEKKSDNNFSIPYCSLIPIGSPCKVTTSGLKWNLKKETLAFGHLVSTSNEIEMDAAIVTVENTQPLLWSMEIEYRNVD